MTVLYSYQEKKLNQGFFSIFKKYTVAIDLPQGSLVTIYALQSPAWSFKKFKLLHYPLQTWHHRFQSDIVLINSSWLWVSKYSHNPSTISKFNDPSLSIITIIFINNISINININIIIKRTFYVIFDESNFAYTLTLFNSSFSFIFFNILLHQCVISVILTCILSFFVCIRHFFGTQRH